MTSYHRPLIQRAVGLGSALALSATFAIGMFWAASVQAAGIVVTSAADGAPANDGQCTLREAIINANRDSTAGSSDCAAGSGADTITFAGGLDGQVIRLSAIGDTNGGPAALAITSTLTLQGSLGAGITIARDSSVANLRLFSVGPAGRLTLSNLTLANGRALGDTPATPGSNGRAGLGGAILSSGGVITLIDSTLRDNIALGGAGAADAASAGGAGGAAMGGAIYADGGAVSIRNSTFSNNSAAGGAGGAGAATPGASGQGQGGGVYGRDGTLLVINSTLSANAADQGGGIFSQSANLTATLALTNTIIAHSLGGTDLAVIGASGLAPQTIGSNNLVERQSGYTGGITAASDPRLGPLANNGGPTQTYALLAGSPALDAGIGTGAPAADQRGQPRGAPDIGSYEAHPWLANIPDQSTNEDTPMTLALQVGDTALASSGFTIGAVSSDTALTPNNGLQFSGSGASRTLTITPAADQFGTAVITVTVDDGGASMQDSFTLTVLAVNDAPVASAGVLTTTEDTSVRGTLSASDIEGDPLTYSIVAAPTKGVISALVASTGVFTYTPGPDANGSDSFSFKVNDGSADSNSATVTISITPVNDPPRFTVGAGPIVNEDAGVQTISGWAQGISAGAANESGQSLMFQVTGDSNPALFAGLPIVAPNGTLTFTPTADASGSATITLRLVDNGGTANGGSDSSAAQTFDITISAVNDPPINSVPGPQTTNEDTARVFNTANGNLISVSDIDAGSSPIYMTLTATSGTLTLGNTAGLTFFFGDGVNDTSVTFIASASAVNAALNGLIYQPLPNSNGSASLTIATNDLGNTGSGGALNDTDTIPITVNPINDPPVNSVPGAQSTNEDTALVFSAANGNQINTSDLDAGASPVRVTLSVIDGALSLAGTNGLTFSSGDGSADMSMTFTGKLTDINAALNGLTYLPAPNDSGPTSITIVTDDLGNTGSGGSLTDTDTIAITVVAVNDAPTITGIADQVTGEDIPSSAIGFKINDVETLSDNLTVSASSSNTTLLPNANIGLGGGQANRTITLTPAANQNGATTITISIGDGVNTTTTSFVLTVEPINDPPTLDPVSDLAVNEDSGARTISLNGISAGPPNESGQALTVTATSDNPALIPNPSVSYSSGSSTGALTFTPAADSNGVAIITIHVNDDGGASSGGSASAQRSFIINVGAVNDPPTLNAIGDITVPENTAIPPLIVSGISAGPPNERGQHLTVTATSDNPALLPNPSISYIDGAITATLSFALTPNTSGAANISVRVADDGGTANGGINAITRTFAITTGLINQRPTLDQPADQMVLEDAATQTIHLSGISAGSANEIGQVLTPTASSDTPNLIAHLSISYTNGSGTGTLEYQLAPDANGTATIRIRVQDNGGTANGAIDFIERTFVVNVTPVNDAPDFMPGPNQSASSRAGPRQIAGWASNFTPGPANESNQIALGYTIVSISNPAIFAVPPAVDASGSLTYTPIVGADGSATIGILVRDSGGIANGGVDTSGIKTFTIRVRPMYYTYIPRS